MLPREFLTDILRNDHNRAILDRWQGLDLPEGWLVAGCLFQTVWNLQSGRAPEADIKDYDLFYFDASDLSTASEQQRQADVQAKLADLGIAVEVVNQARVHTWYEADFGHAYSPLGSACEGIERFLVPCTCVGVRPNAVYAPYGLETLYEGLVTMNPLSPHRDLFDRKATSYKTRWPWLSVRADAPSPQLVRRIWSTA